MDTSGLAGSCLAVQTENSQTIATGYYYCSQQPTSFSSPYCYDPQNGICYGSLYLPDLTLEDMTTPGRAGQRGERQQRACHKLLAYRLAG